MQDVGVVYDKILEDFKHNRSGRIRRQIRNVLNLIEIAKGEDVLEVGVATGKFTALVSRANRVYALDIALDNLRRAKNTVVDMGAPGNLSCVLGDCAKIPFRNSSFDKILAIDITEHLTDDIFVSFCKEAYRILKARGCLYIYTPNLLHPFELSRPFRPVMRREHIGVRTRANMCRILEESGFIMKKSYFNNLFRRISIKAGKP